MQQSTAQHSSLVQHNTAQHSTAQHSIAWHGSLVQHSTAEKSSHNRNIAQHNAVEKSREHNTEQQSTSYACLLVWTKVISLDSMCTDSGFKLACQQAPHSTDSTSTSSPSPMTVSPPLCSTPQRQFNTPPRVRP